MKTKQIFVCGLFAVIIALVFTACKESEPEDPPDLIGTVTISNTAPKVNNTLIASFTGNGSGTAYWNWLADDTPITGANSDIYLVLDDDLGKIIKARVSFSDKSGSVTSDPTSVVQVAGTHIHEWGSWTAIDLAGTDERVCVTDN